MAGSSAMTIISLYVTWIISIMMKTAAPMMGGMNWPPVEDTASTAAAKVGWYPRRFIIGMVNVPVPTTLAVALPEIVPNRVLPTTATFAGPPRTRPKSPKARSMKNRPAPVS